MFTPAPQYGNTPLIIAAERGDLALVQQQLAAGAWVNATNQYDCSALIKAAENGYYDIVALLLQQPGILLNQTTHTDGRSSLMKAIIGGHTEIAKLLIHSGADINLADNKNYTPLMAAICRRDRDIFTLLLEKTHVDINTVNLDEGKSALTIAVCQEMPGAVKDLLDKNADVHTIDKKGVSLMTHAYRMGNKKIMEHISEALGANSGSSEKQKFNLA